MIPSRRVTKRDSDAFMVQTYTTLTETVEMKAVSGFAGWLKSHCNLRLAAMAKYLQCSLQGGVNCGWQASLLCDSQARQTIQ
jgi:hypothetical protein